MPSAGCKIRSGPQQRGTNSEVAASTLPSRGPKRGRKCYVTPAFSGVPKQGFKKGPHQASGKMPLRAVDKIRSGQQASGPKVLQPSSFFFLEVLKLV